MLERIEHPLASDPEKGMLRHTQRVTVELTNTDTIVTDNPLII